MKSFISYCKVSSVWFNLLNFKLLLIAMKSEEVGFFIATHRIVTENIGINSGWAEFFIFCLRMGVLANANTKHVCFILET